MGREEGGDRHADADKNKETAVDKLRYRKTRKTDTGTETARKGRGHGER